MFYCDGMRRCIQSNRQIERARVRVVTAVEVLRPYVLAVMFDDGARREVDVEPLLSGEMFEPLRDPAAFALATVDSTLGTVVWPNGADLSPEFLYDPRPEKMTWRAG